MVFALSFNEHAVLNKRKQQDTSKKKKKNREKF